MLLRPPGGNRMDQRSGRDVDAWSLQTLGGCSLSDRNGPVATTQRVRRLLCFLALGGPSSRPRAARGLWPSSTESRAGASLRAAIVDTQSAAPGVLNAEPSVLSLHGDVHVDLADLRSIVAASEWDDSRSAAELVLQSGHLLPDLYEDWVLSERNDLDMRRLRTLELLGTSLVEENDLVMAAAVAEAAIMLEPLRESSHRLLVEIYLLTGDRVQAYAIYRTFRARSVADFGIAPSEQFRELVEPLRVERRLRLQGPGTSVAGHEPEAPSSGRRRSPRR